MWPYGQVRERRACETTILSSDIHVGIKAYRAVLSTPNPRSNHGFVEGPAVSRPSKWPEPATRPLTVYVMLLVLLLYSPLP